MPRAHGPDARGARRTWTPAPPFGALSGRQNRTYGYDMLPNKKLTRSQFASFFTRWHYAPIRMASQGRFVSVQPMGP